MKKSFFRRITALLCCILLFVVPMKPAVYAAGETDCTVQFIVNDNLTICDRTLTELVKTDTSVAAKDWNYTYVDNVITISAFSGAQLVSSKFYLFVKASIKPTVEQSDLFSEIIVADSPTVKNGNTYWRITITVTEFDDEDCVYTFTPGKEYVDVTFPVDYDNYNIKYNDQAVNGETVSVEKGNDVIFNVELVNSEKYNCTVRANGTVVDPETNGSYKVSANAKTTITVSVSPKPFTVNGPTVSDGYKYAAVTSNPVTYGGSFQFYVTPNNGFPDPEVNITGTAKLQALSGNLYIINDIRSNINITVDQAEANKYSVTLPEGTGYEAELVGTESSFTYGTNAEFTVTATTGYKVTSVTATTNGVTTTLNATNGKYSVNVKGDTIINVAVQKLNHPVTYEYDETSSAFTVKKGAASAEHGSSYTFYVIPTAGYSDPIVKVNSVETKPVNGTQYAIDITKVTNIEITAGTQHQYDIKLIDGDGFVYNHDGFDLKVNHGDNFVFDVTLLPEYSNSTPIVSVDGTQITKNANGKYEISNITANKTVTVSGVQKNAYRVTLKNGNGYKLETTYNTLVTSGDEFVFSVNVASGFGGNYSVQVKLGETTKTLPKNDNNEYNIKVTAPTEISVAGIDKLTFNVTTPTIPNANFEAVTEGNEVSYGGSYQFRVTANDGYRVQAVAVNGNTVTPVNGVYTVSNVTSTLNIEAEIKANVLTVNYVTYEKNHNDSSTGTFTIDTLSSVTAKTFKSCSVHKFVGWLQDDSNEVPADNFASKISTSDATVTLVARYELFTGEEAIDNLVKLMQTERLVSENPDAAGYYHMTFRTLANVIAAAQTDPCVAEYVTVTGHGTLLSSTTESNVNFADSKIVDFLSQRDRKTTTPIIAQRIDGLDFKMYNYYMNSNLKLLDVNGENIGLGLTSKTPEQRIAAGWMELTILNQRVIVVSQPNS